MLQALKSVAAQDVLTRPGWPPESWWGWSSLVETKISKISRMGRPGGYAGWNYGTSILDIFMGNIGELIAISGILGRDTDKSRCWEILDQKIWGADWSADVEWEYVLVDVVVYQEPCRQMPVPSPNCFSMLRIIWFEIVPNPNNASSNLMMFTYFLHRNSFSCQLRSLLMVVQGTFDYIIDFWHTGQCNN